MSRQASTLGRKRAIALYIKQLCLAPRPLDLDVRPSSEAIDHTLRDCQSKPRSSLCWFLQQLKP